MCLASNIARRAGSSSYYARLGVPKDLQPIMGKKELWKSLDTKNAREAKERAPEVLAEWHAEFAELRRRRDALPLTADALSAATWEHYRGELEQHQLERSQLPNSAEIEAESAKLVAEIQAGSVPWTDDPLVQTAAASDVLHLQGRADLNAEFRARRKATLEKHLAKGETALVADSVRAITERENLAILPGSPEFRDLAKNLLRAEIEALRRAEEQDRGDFTGQVRDPIVKAPSGKPAAPVAAPGESISDLLAVYADDNRARLTADTIQVNKQIVGMFAEFVGLTLPVSAIDKKQVFAWKSALRCYPIRAAEISQFKGMSFRKIIAENERLKRPTLSDKTVNRYLSALGGFCTWAQGNGLIGSNPVEGMLIKIDKSQSKIRPYTSDQLTRIFASPLFTGCQSEDAPHRPGNLQIRDHRYWLPLLSLFTGARMGELAQLLTADVREDRGRWIIHITREGDDAKTTKTEGSQRVVPVHPELERLGFIAFHAARSATGEKRLFPEIKPDARGQLTGNVSRFWGRYVQRIGVKDDASVNFHSFRHGMTDALRRAGFRDEEFGFLLGHTKATTTGRYGILKEGELKQRCALIDAVNFPDLDLSHLQRG